jgi:hypothetical protein
VTFICGDAHVHIYEEFDLGQLFGAALARSEELSAPLLLLLAESAGYDYFSRLQRAAQEGATVDERDLATPNPAIDAPRSARLHLTSEPLSIALKHSGPGAGAVFVIAGRQLISRTQVEVLALALDPSDPVSSIPDGSLPTSSLAQRVLRAGAAAALPWGIGKWIGTRGAEVVALISNASFRENPLFFVGDIAHRCWPWPTPRAFRGPARVLAGTDILAVRGAEQKVARYGFRVAGSFDPERPAASLLGIFRKGEPIEAIGQRDSLLSTLKEQARYRLRRS